MSVPGDSSGGGRGRRPSACRSTGQRFALDIVREGGDWTGFSPIEPAIEAAAEALAALPAIAPVVGEATIVLASDAHVRGLNAAWRSQDKPTNILSFPAAPHPAGIAGQGLPFLGDIVLAAETLAREAAADGTPLHHHLQHLVIHGLLHLVGYDHETDSEAEVMEALEVAALARLGVPSPYDDCESVTT